MMVTGTIAVVVGLMLYIIGAVEASDKGAAFACANLGCMLIGAGAAYFSLCRERRSRRYRGRR